MMTKDQYIESLRKLNLNLYMFGKKVENPVDDPVIRPSLNSFAAGRNGRAARTARQRLSAV